jgi:predicted nucleic acid-binding protein
VAEGSQHRENPATPTGSVTMRLTTLLAQGYLDNVTSRNVTILTLSAADYQVAIDKVASLGLWSGVIYDALLTTAAQNAGIERLYTFNMKHFLQVWPEGSAIITAP